MNENVTLKGKPTGQLDCKRCHLPGVVLEAVCPKCGVTTTRDYGDDYLGYPLMNKVFSEHLYCNGCDYEWPARLEFKVELVLANVD